MTKCPALTAGITAEFPHYLPKATLASGADKVSQLVSSPDALKAIKVSNPALHEGIIQAYSHAIDRVFLIAAEPSGSARSPRC